MSERFGKEMRLPSLRTGSLAFAVRTDEFIDKAFGTPFSRMSRVDFAMERALIIYPAINLQMFLPFVEPLMHFVE